MGLSTSHSVSYLTSTLCRFSPNHCQKPHLMINLRRPTHSILEPEGALDLHVKDVSDLPGVPLIYCWWQSLDGNLFLLVPKPVLLSWTTQEGLPLRCSPEVLSLVCVSNKPPKQPEGGIFQMPLLQGFRSRPGERQKWKKMNNTTFNRLGLCCLSMYYSKESSQKPENTPWR